MNLTCANRIILVDPWWNHSVELQAFARIFRIGQKKQTHFVTLLAKDTIDIRLFKLQTEKLDEIALQHTKTTDRKLEEQLSLFGRLREDEDEGLVLESDYEDEKSLNESTDED